MVPQKRLIPLTAARCARLIPLITALLLVGCDSSWSFPVFTWLKSRVGEAGGTLHLGLPYAPTTGNPLLARDVYTATLLGQLYPPLIHAGGAGEDPILPGLAQAWEMADDGLSVTFTLRGDVAWSDGEPITAQDVIFSWKAHTHEAIAWAAAPTKAGIKTVTAEGSDTVRFTLKHPTPQSLIIAGSGPILPAHHLGDGPMEALATQDLWRRPVTGGPFVLHKKRDDIISLRPNRHWAEEARPFLKEVQFKIFEGEAALTQAALAGDIDYLPGIPPDQWQAFNKAADWRALAVDDYTTDFIAWNTTRAPLDSAAVRQAMTLAIDRGALVTQLLGQRGRVGHGPIHSTQWAFDPQLPQWPVDRERALEDLAEAGWRDSDGDGWLDNGAERLSFSLLVNEESSLRARYAGAIRDQLRAIGVRVVVRTLPMSQLTRLALAHDFDALLSTWRGGPLVDLSMLHSKAAAGGYNYGSFADPGLDRILDEVSVVDRDRALSLWSQAQGILNKAQPYTVLAERQRVDGVRGDLQVPTASATPLRDLGEWWFKKPTTAQGDDVATTTQAAEKEAEALKAASPGP